MSKEAVFTMKLEPELRAQFMAEANAIERSASQIVREMMRDFVQRQRDEREYQAFLLQKVTLARQAMHADQGRSNEDVEAEFAVRRAQALAKNPA